MSASTTHPSPSCLPSPAATHATPSCQPSSDSSLSETSPSPHPSTRAPSTPIDRPAASLISYHNPIAGTLGCSHYARKCQVRAPCCPPFTFYPCRFCHDEQCDHSIDRHAITDMVCMHCAQHTAKTNNLTPARSQPVAATCIDCTQRMARYYCDVCKFFDDAVDRDIFHCTACGICRRGKREEFFHCQRCNCCYSSSLRAGHKCIENVLSSVW